MWKSCTNRTPRSESRRASKQFDAYVSPRLLHFWSVQIEDVLRFPREICQLWDRGLHAECQFVLRDTSRDFRVTDDAKPDKSVVNISEPTARS
jgi:hypothetical protein